MDENFTKCVEGILEKDPRYTAEAYTFVSEAVTFTADKLGKGSNGPSRHVTGEELVQGVCDRALQEFGFLAADVLEYWGVLSGPDVGCIVYNLIDGGMLSASSEDSQSDFDCAFHLTDDLRERAAKELILPPGFCRETPPVLDKI